MTVVMESLEIDSRSSAGTSIFPYGLSTSAPHSSTFRRSPARFPTQEFGIASLIRQKKRVELNSWGVVAFLCLIGWKRESLNYIKLMNEAAFQIIFQFIVYSHYTYSLMNSYGKWFCFAYWRLTIQQFKLNVRFVSIIPPYPKEKALFKCSEVLPVCRSDGSSDNMKITVKECFN